MREIIFDTETTGLSPRDGDRIVEIGCLEMIHRVPTGAVFHAYFNPDRPMSAAAEAVHGLSDAFLADKPAFAARADELLAFLGEAPLVAHNASFDMGFLNAELVLCDRAPIDPARMIDTLALARVRHPGAKHSLDALCTRYGIDRAHRTRHGALLDAELLAQVYVELTGGRQIGLDLAKPAAMMPGGGSFGGGDLEGGGFGDISRMPGGDAGLRRVFRAPRPHAASPEERAAHNAFLETITAPLWTA